MKREFGQRHSACTGLFACLALLALPAWAVPLEIPVSLDYRILEQELRQQVFSGPGSTVQVYADQLNCNVVTLADPKVSGTDDGRVRVVASMQARVGTVIGNTCGFATAWNGVVETLHTASVDPIASRATFPVTGSSLKGADGGEAILPPYVQGMLEEPVNSRLGNLALDLAPALDGVSEALDAMTVEGGVVEPEVMRALLSTLRLAEVRPSNAALVAILALDVPDAPPDFEPQAQAPLTEPELAAWDDAWQAWDAFATWTIKTLALSAGPELTAALADTLLEARYDLRNALTSDERNRDPVRALFLQTWERLAPLVEDLQLAVPGGQALRYATFVSAGNALQALDQLAPHIGFRLDRDSLRSLARALVPGVTDYELRYDTAVDPELRTVLGLPAEFEMEEVEPGASGPLETVLTWLFRDALATAIDPELVGRLNSWIPERNEIDSYLETMAELLDAISAAERARGKVPSEHLATYDTLLRATAFTESCWRQYVERGGTIKPISSSAGSVGLMQINVHVWRGIYEVDTLHSDIGYNARAGNEILVHYLVDYAIRKGEGEATGVPDSLARATYGVYNGGPRHLTRYRNPNASASLKHIDDTFWTKYRAIQTEGLPAVKRCLAG